MKAALNGVLNCSILDGWWAEAYSPGLRLRDRAARKRDERSRTRPTPRRCTRCSRSRCSRRTTSATSAGLPQRWIALMRESIAELGPRFGTARMVAEYVERLYLPAHEGAARPASRVA